MNLPGRDGIQRLIRHTALRDQTAEARVFGPLHAQSKWGINAEAQSPVICFRRIGVEEMRHDVNGVFRAGASPVSRIVGGSEAQQIRAEPHVVSRKLRNPGRVVIDGGGVIGRRGERFPARRGTRILVGQANAVGVNLWKAGLQACARKDCRPPLDFALHKCHRGHAAEWSWRGFQEWESSGHRILDKFLDRRWRRVQRL